MKTGDIIFLSAIIILLCMIILQIPAAMDYETEQNELKQMDIWRTYEEQELNKQN